MASLSRPLLIVFCLWLGIASTCSAASRSSVLSRTYYKKSCPRLEQTLYNFLSDWHANSPNISAQMVRLLFHDTLINGVDASVLLKGIPGSPAEQDLANLALNGFEFVEAAKALVEAKCPGVVSCADVLTLLTKAAVFKAGGPLIGFKLGRLDGHRNTPEAHSAMNPKASFNATQLRATFSKLGLNELDLIALSGAHTLGQTHCSKIRPRLYPNVDPRYDPNFGADLLETCPIADNSTNPVTLVSNPVQFDQTSTKFDNNYYKMLFKGRGVQNSDQVLSEDPRLSKTTYLFSQNYKAFSSQFVKSMIKMSQVNLPSTGEIRTQCGYMNTDSI